MTHASVVSLCESYKFCNVLWNSYIFLQKMQIKTIFGRAQNFEREDFCDLRCFLSERQIDQKIKTLWWKIERATSENGLKMASSKTAFFRRFSPARILLETRRGEIERADSESGLRKPFCKNCYFRVSHHLVKPVQEIRNRHFCDLRRFCGCVKNVIFVTSVFFGFWY